MVQFLYAEINIVCIILLLIMFWMSVKKIAVIPTDQRIFNMMLLCNILVCIVDTVMWVLEGVPGSFARYINIISTTIYYILNPLMCCIWIFYSDFKLYEDINSLRKREPFYMILTVIVTVMALASPFTHWLFTINEKNHYMRGELFLAMAIPCFLYLGYSFFMTVHEIRKNGWNENRNCYFYLLVFPIAILALAILQTLFFGLSLIWVGSTLALFSIYINMQNTELSVDPLTGLFNRSRLDKHLYRAIRTEHEGELFVILLDIDCFKSINDTFGHLVGDDALRQTAKILHSACRKKGYFIARMGGDEFMIVGEAHSEPEVRQQIKTIEGAVAKFNSADTKPYTISLSIGHALYRKGVTTDSLIAEADVKMYRQKQIHKEKCLL